MEIYNGTGKLKTEELKVNKSITSIIIASSLAVTEIVNETITVFIERVNGSNVFLAQSVKLIDFLSLTNYGNDAVQSSTEFSTIAVCELGEAAVQLNEGETLKIKLENLKADKTYAMYGVEDPDTTLDTLQFDRKTIGAEDVQKTIDVTNAYLMVLDLHTSIKEVSFKFVNGVTVRYLPIELRTISRDIDPIYAIKSDGTVLQGLATRCTIPLVGVASVEVIKETGSTIDLVTVKHINLLNV